MSPNQRLNLRKMRALVRGKVTDLLAERDRAEFFVLARAPTIAKRKQL